MHAIRSQLSRKSDENVFLPKQIPKITMADFEYALSVVTPSTQRETHVDFAKVSWDEIAGLDSIKLVFFLFLKILKRMNKLKQSVEWPLTLSHVFSNFGLSPPRGKVKV
jgi:SpoVK/Ycf46/Vps4 family AAA+-type ATPase